MKRLRIESGSDSTDPEEHTRGKEKIRPSFKRQRKVQLDQFVPEMASEEAIPDDQDSRDGEESAAPWSQRRQRSCKVINRKPLSDSEEDQENDDDDDDDDDAVFSPSSTEIYASSPRAFNNNNNRFKASLDVEKILALCNQSSAFELSLIKGLSKKKIARLLQLRPFKSWTDLERISRDDGQLGGDVVTSLMEYFELCGAISSLMDRCESISRRIEGLVKDLMDGDRSSGSLVTSQPELLSRHLALTDHQLKGLSWLVIMHQQRLNGILADDMGLGKTIQTIAFLAHLKQTGHKGPYLIMVTSSTLNNWMIELEAWCPALKVIKYRGSMEERRQMRHNMLSTSGELFDVVLTTYTMATRTKEDRSLFKKLKLEYGVFDEAHVLKNMLTQRYDQLMQVTAKRRLLLTGTPMQNNLHELMSLLVFVMPDLFVRQKDRLKQMFAAPPTAQGPNGADRDIRSEWERGRMAQAKRIMKPFILRRLKQEVLLQLPEKTEQIIRVAMLPHQRTLYADLVNEYKAKVAGDPSRSLPRSALGFLMNLRKVANHPLLIRRHYDADRIRNMASTLKNDRSHEDADEQWIMEDLEALSDLEIHQTCLKYRCLEPFCLDPSQLCQSGKFAQMDVILPELKAKGERVLIFSQFTSVLDILELYLDVRGHLHLRLDGSTAVPERQKLIDQFHNDPHIFVFILSTKAGGLGINLTAANVVILHDLDYNPYNDKQAEDRCHRLGQRKPVKVIKLLSQDSIDEAIFAVAQDKLQLERHLSADHDDDDSSLSSIKPDVPRLLRFALAADISSS